MRNLSSILYILIFIGATYLFLLLLTTLIMRKAKKCLLQLSSQIGGKLKRTILGSVILETLYKEKPFKIKITPPSRGAPATIVIKLLRDCSFKLWITTECKFSKLEKKLGLYYKEIKIGISEFDDRFLLNTKDENSVRSFLSNSPARKAISQLFEKGWSQMYIRKNGLTIERDISTSAGMIKIDDLEQDKIIKALENLSILSAYLF